MRKKWAESESGFSVIARRRFPRRSRRLLRQSTDDGSNLRATIVDQSLVWCVPARYVAVCLSQFFRVSKSSLASWHVTNYNNIMKWLFCVSFETTALTASLRLHSSPVIIVYENVRQPSTTASPVVGRLVRSSRWFCCVLWRQLVPRSWRSTAVVLRRSVYQGTEYHWVRAPELIQDTSLLRWEVSQSRMVSIQIYTLINCFPVPPCRPCGTYCILCLPN